MIKLSRDYELVNVYIASYFHLPYYIEASVRYVTLIAINLPDIHKQGMKYSTKHYNGYSVVTRTYFVPNPSDNTGIVYILKFEQK